MKHMFYVIWLHLPCIVHPPPLLFHPFLQRTHTQHIFMTFDLIPQQPIHFFFYNVSNDSLAKNRLSGDGAHIQEAWLGT